MADYEGGIVINKKFERTFKSEEELIQKFDKFVRQYLGMAQGLNIGNIMTVADNLTFALKSQLGNYDPDRRLWFGTYRSTESIKESACSINYEQRLNMYMFRLRGNVFRQESYFLLGKVSSSYRSDLEWTVGTAHANTVLGEQYLLRGYNKAMAGDEGVNRAMDALLYGARYPALQ